MDPVCPRCQTLLTPASRYCLECGAPRFTVEVQQADPEGAQNNFTTGPLVAWPTAFGIAALLAVPVGTLCAMLSFSTLWVVAGGVWTITLYHRRIRSRPQPRLSTGLGSRVGLVFGIFAAVVATAIDAGRLLVTRYGLHHGAEIDSRLRVAMQAGIDRVLATNPDAVHQIPWFFHFWLSAYGQAALVLASAVLSAGSMLGFSALGGAIGARYAGPRRLLAK